MINHLLGMLFKTCFIIRCFILVPTFTFFLCQAKEFLARVSHSSEIFCVKNIIFSNRYSFIPKKIIDLYMFRVYMIILSLYDGRMKFAHNSYKSYYLIKFEFYTIISLFFHTLAKNSLSKPTIMDCQALSRNIILRNR